MRSDTYKQHAYALVSVYLACQKLFGPLETASIFGGETRTISSFEQSTLAGYYKTRYAYVDLHEWLKQIVADTVDQAAEIDSETFGAIASLHTMKPLAHHSLFESAMLLKAFLKRMSLGKRETLSTLFEIARVIIPQSVNENFDLDAYKDSLRKAQEATNPSAINTFLDIAASSYLVRDLNIEDRDCVAYSTFVALMSDLGFISRDALLKAIISMPFYNIMNWRSTPASIMFKDSQSLADLFSDIAYLVNAKLAYSVTTVPSGVKNPKSFSKGLSEKVGALPDDLAADVRAAIAAGIATRSRRERSGGLSHWSNALFKGRQSARTTSEFIVYLHEDEVGRAAFKNMMMRDHALFNAFNNINNDMKRFKQPVCRPIHERAIKITFETWLSSRSMAAETPRTITASYMITMPINMYCLIKSGISTSALSPLFDAVVQRLESARQRVQLRARIVQAMLDIAHKSMGHLNSLMDAASFAAMLADVVRQDLADARLAETSCRAPLRQEIAYDDINKTLGASSLHIV